MRYNVIPWSIALCHLRIMLSKVMCRLPDILWNLEGQHHFLQYPILWLLRPRPISQNHIYRLRVNVSLIHSFPECDLFFHSDWGTTNHASHKIVWCQTHRPRSLAHLSVAEELVLVLLLCPVLRSTISNWHPPYSPEVLLWTDWNRPDVAASFSRKIQVGCPISLFVSCCRKWHTSWCYESINYAICSILCSSYP